MKPQTKRDAEIVLTTVLVVLFLAMTTAEAWAPHVARMTATLDEICSPDNPTRPVECDPSPIHTTLTPILIAVGGFFLIANAVRRAIRRKPPPALPEEDLSHVPASP